MVTPSERQHPLSLFVALRFDEDRNIDQWRETGGP
jgi:hypothetical protein